MLDQKRDGSQLIYKRIRYYDPATGRFTQEDPIGLAGGLNLYGFAGGDPVNFSDPFGLCYGPLENACARVAVFFLGRVFPAIAEWSGALSGLGAGSSGHRVYHLQENTRAAATISRWTAVFEGNIDKFDDLHLDAAVREAAGEVVKWDVSRGQPYNHLLEVRNSMQDMRNVAAAMKRLLEQGQPTETQREAAIALRQRAMDALDSAREAGVTRR